MRYVLRTVSGIVPSASCTYGSGKYRTALTAMPRRAASALSVSYASRQLALRPTTAAKLVHPKYSIRDISDLATCNQRLKWLKDTTKAKEFPKTGQSDKDKKHRLGFSLRF